MGMVVRTNYSALNATRNLTLNSKALDGSLEKLASGYKVNKAADDASGLAISEKMKAQISALTTASSNAEDGISLVQTAEGYLSEVHSMLNRMVELSLKSANGILESVSGSQSSTANSGVIGAAGTDRDALQLEMDQLCAEIDRISATANFNNVRLFDGSLSTKSTYKLTYSNTAQQSYTLKESFAFQTLVSGYVTLGISTLPVGVDTGSQRATSGLRLQIGETSREADKLTVSLLDLSTAALFHGISAFKSGDGVISATGGIWHNGLIQWNRSNTVHVSGRADAISGFTLNISNQNMASLASDAIRKIINTVSMQRATLGAIQNRLEHTINNLDTASENMSAANSRIRDTDVAKEMSAFTKNNVLAQAAQSMLAQANQRPQQALQLMGG